MGLSHALHAVSYTLGRLDLIDARSADEAMSLLREHLEERRESGTLDPDQYVVGMRFRHSLWADDAQPTLAAIDAVSGDQPWRCQAQTCIAAG